MSHALLSASGAYKWLACTPSARLEETLPESTSSYAEEGRLAHEIAELKVRKQFVEPMGVRSFNARLKKLQQSPLYQGEMLSHTEKYKDYLSGIVHGFCWQPYVAIEKKLQYDKYVPEGFGTGDAVIIGADTLHIVDFKYGKGLPVFADSNPQMMLYALGAYSAYSFLFAIKTVKMAIFQPRLDNVSECEMSVDDLLAWGESIKLTAQSAFKGEGEFVSGEHCRFCRAKALCRNRADTNTALEVFKAMKPPLITNEEVGQILERGRCLAKWLSDLEAYALTACLTGSEIPGWKAVEGRGSRQYVNQDEAFKMLCANGYDEAMLFQRVPLSVPNVEKLIGKAKYNELLVESGNVISQPGKPTLASASDKREAITRQSAKDIFQNEGGTENE